MQPIAGPSIAQAIKAACLSSQYRHRVGAALFCRKNLISLGWNKRKTHPACPTENSQHAEFNVCIGLDESVFEKRTTLFVARLTKAGKVAMAKPCKDCQDFLKVLGIKDIYYTNTKGILEKL